LFFTLICFVLAVLRPCTEINIKCLITFVEKISVLSVCTCKCF